MADETVMTCLKGYIGISPDVCADPEPPAEGEEGIAPSSLFITDLPGISLESIEKLADADLKNFRGVWKVVEKRALLKFRSAVLVEINKCFCISDKAVIDCIVCGNKESFAMPLWYLLGVELCNERLGSSAINRYTTIDKKNAERLRADFEVDFQTELSNAMKGVDITDCVDEKPPAGGNVRYVETTDLC